jgi:hypothetical protein
VVRHRRCDRRYDPNWPIPSPASAEVLRRQTARLRLREIVSILAREIRGSDRLTDEQGEWEVDTESAALHGGKTLHARLRKVGEPGIVRYVTWPVHERVTIRRRG